MLALALAVLPFGVQAAGLGKLTVVSALGQPLRAEIELTASREEYSSLSARLASAEAFRGAGIEYSPALAGIRFSLDRRADGQPYLQVTSDRPLNEPFIDMLVEVNWTSGRLVREYTFLLDPPDVFRKPPMVPVAAPEVKPPAAAAQPAEAPRVAAPASDTLPVRQPAAVAPPPAPKAAERPAPSASREVVRGDTLSKIAGEVKPEGVNLDQMLVALFRSNKDAFEGGNMNRLRAGKILSIPDREAVAAVEQKEARTVVVAQAADFSAYRQKLAGIAAAAPAREEAPKQVATGKIAPRVEDKVPAPPAGKDKLEVSRVEGKAGAPGGQDRIAAIEEDLVAREKALKDANSRIAELEKNLNDLKRLAEMRSTAGAKLQEQASAAKPVTPPAAAVKPGEPAAPTPAPQPAEAVAPVPAAKPADVAAPTEASPPPATAPVPKKPVVVPPPPPPPPPSFVEDNPELVFGGGGVLALLLGYLGYNAWRRKRQAAGQSPTQGGAVDAAASVFGTTGGQSVDTGEALPTDFSQDAGPDLGDEGVDPVDEADVYIAYGRDSQAEEILLEALKSEPSRAAIHLKLLEIHAARKSLPQFQTVARDLQALTAGTGADWDKAVALGRSIDPANPLYGGAAEPVVAEDSVTAESTGDATQAMPGELAQLAAVATGAAIAAAPESAPPAEEIPPSLDFDLDLGEAPKADEPAVLPIAEPAADEVMSLDFDLDLGAEPASAAAEHVVEPETAVALDFDLDLGAAPEAAAAEAPAGDEPSAAIDPHSMDFDLGAAETPAETPADPASADASAVDPDRMDFDLDLGAFDAAEPAPVAAGEPSGDEGGIPPLDFDLGSVDTPAVETPLELPAVETPVELPSAAPRAAAFDLSAISLDLDQPVESAPAEADAPATETPVADDPEVATKLELAQAYEEMGDKEGARELLNEVLTEGSPAQRQAARDKLAQLG